MDGLSLSQARIQTLLLCSVDTAPQHLPISGNNASLRRGDLLMGLNPDKAATTLNPPPSGIRVVGIYNPQMGRGWQGEWGSMLGHAYFTGQETPLDLAPWLAEMLAMEIKRETGGSGFSLLQGLKIPPLSFQPLGVLLAAG